jgi:hypothetical protein
MKKILGLALGLTMISLTPAVGNAAGIIVAECLDVTYIFDISGGKQTIPDIGEADIKFTEDMIIAKAKDGSFIWNFKENKMIDNNGVDIEIKCNYKNLELIKQALLNQNKKPVSTSVQQRLQALEERMDRLESSMKK